MQHPIRISGTLAILWLSACSHSYKMEHPSASSNQITPLIEKGARVLVTLPKDGAYGNRPYASSGASTQGAIISTLNSMGADAVPGPFCEDPRDAAPMGLESNATWIVMPRIQEWEDRLTEFSGTMDRLRIEIRTTGVLDRSSADLTVVDGTSRWGGGGLAGGDHPQDMLRPALRPWANAIMKK